MNRAINTLTRCQTELMMWTEGFHVVLLNPLFSLHDHHLTRISHCLGHRPCLIVSFPETDHKQGTKSSSNFCCNVEDIPFIQALSKHCSQKAIVVSILFTFKHSWISYFAIHHRQTTNYRVDIPWVLQRFSINCKPPDPSFLFVIMGMWAYMQTVTPPLVLI